MAKTKAAKAAKQPFRSRGTIETWAPRSRPRVLAKVAPGASSVGVPRVTKPCATRSKPGTSELVFLPAAEAGAAGATPGATVRLCTGKKKPGYLVSVRSAEEATRVARDWKVCMTDAGADGAARAKACAEKVAPQARFGAAPGAAPGGRSALERPTGSTLRLGARRNQKLRHELRHARLDLETTEAAARLYPGEESARRVELAKQQLTETEARVKARGRLSGAPQGAPRPSDDGPADITAVKMQGMPITMFEGKRERKKRRG